MKPKGSLQCSQDCHSPLSWARWKQSTPSINISFRYILILSSYLRLGLHSGVFPSGFRTKFFTHFSPHPCALHAPPIMKWAIKKKKKDGRGTNRNWGKLNLQTKIFLHVHTYILRVKLFFLTPIFFPNFPPLSTPLHHIISPSAAADKC
jgi:hypothetical protein